MTSQEDRLDLLFAKELATIDGKPDAGAKLEGPKSKVRFQAEPPGRDLVGLALSGGGIRSATFNLGLLQGLAKQRVLGVFDYLSTVSGGGYVGAFWSAWRSRKPHQPSGSFPSEPKPGEEAPEVRHLRTFGNFLRPRLQLLSFETGRFVTAIFAGLLPAASAALAFLAFMLLFWLALAWTLTTGAATGKFTDALPAAVAFGLLSLAVQAAFEAFWLCRRTEEPAARALGWYWAVAFASSLVGAGLWWLVWHVLPVPTSRLLAPSPADVLVAAGLLAPVVVWLVLVLLLVGLRTAYSRAENRLEARQRVGAADRVISRLLVCAGAWGVAATAWFVGQVVAAEGWGLLTFCAGTAGAGGSAFAWARRLLFAAPASPAPGKARRALLWPLLKLLAFLTLLAAGAGVAALVATIGGEMGTEGLWWSFGAVAGLLLLALVLFDPHGISFHSFYRARLVRAYLGASNVDHQNGEAAECTGDDLVLRELAAGKPFHLICCAANDLDGDPLHSLHRGAESAVASRLGFQVGAKWRSWESREPSLGAVMTASGAAVNNHMGMHSMRLGRTVTFLMTALNLRLGCWVRGVDSDGRLERLYSWLPGVLFFRELLGSSRSDAGRVFLSDGAHFDNLGLYELVRRHCRYILVSDCGADPTVAFDDLGNAVRRVREDFGVEIELDTAPLTPGPDRRIARQPMVAGEIRYPSGDAGILLYVKPTLTGREPSDVAQYAGRNTTFPHETTLDQFFDEAQWESYRRLGEHVAEVAVGKLAPVRARQDPNAKEVNAGSLFVHAHMAWRSSPLGDSTGIDRFREDWAELEAMLFEDSEAQDLRDEIYDPTDAEDPKEGIPGSPEEPTSATDVPANLAKLPYAQRAFQCMEYAYLHTGFGTEPTHRESIGWLNLFSRWASAPALRAWWPWLEPLYARSFVDFAERVLYLPGRGKLRPSIELLPATPIGYAWSRWHCNDRSLPQGSNRYGFFLAWSGRRLLGGLVEVQSAGGDFSWRACDFFIPPGLWGIGFGEIFLQQLVDHLAKQGAQTLTVWVEDKPSRPDSILYPGGGFRWQAATKDTGARFVRKVVDDA